MKYAIIGDIHGTDLNNLENTLDRIYPDVIICTGDFDQPKIVHQFINLERKYRNAGKRVIKVPGNHDHAVLNNLRITSYTLFVQGKTIRELHEEFSTDYEAKNYLGELVNSPTRVKIFLDEKRFGKKYQTVIIHGAYAGNILSYPGCPDKIRDLWIRLLSEEDYKANFEAMEQNGDKIMLRGHDHYTVYAYEDVDGEITINEPMTGKPAYKLYENRLHIVNPGALFDGYFAIIDTDNTGLDVPILKYLKI
jgi:predicted phosphodiesterase